MAEAANGVALSPETHRNSLIPHSGFSGVNLAGETKRVHTIVNAGRMSARRSACPRNQPKSSTGPLAAKPKPASSETAIEPTPPPAPVTSTGSEAGRKFQGTPGQTGIYNGIRAA